MDYDFIDENELHLTGIENEVWTTFVTLIMLKRDAFFALTVNQELSQAIRDDARRRGKYLDKFLKIVTLAEKHIENDKETLDKATKQGSSDE